MHNLSVSTCHVKFILNVVIICMVIITGLPGLSNSQNAFVEPGVYENLSLTESNYIWFWAIFKEKADLKPAYMITDWNERGWFVYNQLQETAETSQVYI